MAQSNHELEQYEELAARWGVVQSTLSGLIADCQSRLCDRGQTASLEVVREVQAEIRTYKVLMNLPERKIRELESKLGKKEQHG